MTSDDISYETWPPAILLFRGHMRQKKDMHLLRPQHVNPFRLMNVRSRAWHCRHILQFFEHRLEVPDVDEA